MPLNLEAYMRGNLVEEQEAQAGEIPFINHEAENGGYVTLIFGCDEDGTDVFLQSGSARPLTAQQMDSWWDLFCTDEKQIAFIPEGYMQTFEGKQLGFKVPANPYRIIAGHFIEEAMAEAYLEELESCEVIDAGVPDCSRNFRRPILSILG